MEEKIKEIINLMDDLSPLSPVDKMCLLQSSEQDRCEYFNCILMDLRDMFRNVMEVYNKCDGCKHSCSERSNDELDVMIDKIEKCTWSIISYIRSTQGDLPN